MEPTQGPWIAHNSPDGYSITDGGGKEIARLFGQATSDREFGGGRFGLNDHDNAKLIAIAPELRDALRALLGTSEVEYTPEEAKTFARSVLEKLGGR
jgi:hypothetical protein